jgi:hypothetical protein
MGKLGFPKSLLHCKSSFNQSLGDVENQARSLYFEETIEGQHPLRNKILRNEIK